MKPNEADREAARVWLVNTPAVEDWCGYEDQRALVQAFAAHRIAALEEAAQAMQTLKKTLGVVPGSPMDWALMNAEATIRALKGAE